MEDRIMPFIYLVSSNGLVHQYAASGTGTNLRLNYAGQTLRGKMQRSRSIDIDPVGTLEHGPLAVTTNPTPYQCQIWSLKDRANPRVLSLFDPNAGLPNPNTCSIKYPFMWMGTAYSSSPPSALFDITDPAHPVKIQTDLFDMTKPWNTAPYVADMTATHMKGVNRHFMFLSRYSQLQRFQINAGGGPEFSPPVLMDSSSQIDDPRTPRSLGARVFYWKGRSFLMNNLGNELEIYDTTDPLNPNRISQSRFRVPPFGDRDYNLFNFSVVDNGRYGIAGFDMMGSVVFDLGTGDTPRFTSHRYYGASTGFGGFVFKSGPNMYGILNNIHEQGEWLCLMSGVDQDMIISLQHITTASGNPYTVDGGFALKNSISPVQQDYYL